MTHVTLQRVMVRMLFDQGFTERVRREPAVALAGLELSEREIDWLLEPDPRAWRADADRPARALSVLLQEYPAALALVVQAHGDLAPVQGYFASTYFHRIIQDKGSMALAFGDYVVALVAGGAIHDPRVTEVARLEQAIVRLHRQALPRGPEVRLDAPFYRLSPDKALHRAAAGTADLHEAIHGALGTRGKDLGRAVLAVRRLPNLPLGAPATEPLLLELARDDGPRVKFLTAAAEITSELFDLLAFSRVPRDFAALVTEVTRLGADPDEAPEVIAGLIGEGVLTAQSP